MNLKNYTSGVPVERTVASIEKALAEAGAIGTMKDYKNGELSSLSFKMALPTGKIISIRLPANHEAVFDSMRKGIVRPREGTIDRLKAQALRTSWKLMQDWVEVQLSLIKMQQVEPLQVFLPYVWDGQQTFYAALKEKRYLALPEATE